LVEKFSLLAFAVVVENVVFINLVFSSPLLASFHLQTPVKLILPTSLNLVVFAAEDVF